MNIIEVMNTINKYGRYLAILVLLLNLFSVSFADATSQIKSAMTELCEVAQSFLILSAMVLIVLAGAIYAIGQIMGAETRARAAVWATAMLTGAIIGLVIYLVTPYVISTLLPKGTSTSINPANPCQFTTAGGGGGG